MRTPGFAGTFYPNKKEELLAQLNPLFQEKTDFFDDALGIIVPHAGYTYSGKVAAKTYKAISKIKKRKFVVLGVDHYGTNVISTSKQSWRTPMGDAKIDSGFTDKITREKAITQNEIATEREHSIEVQLPFLQYVFKDFEFVPVQLPYISYKEILRLRDILISKDYFFIASSDFTHYGIPFGFAPSESFHNPPDYVKKLDEKIIEAIQDFDGKKFYDFVIQRNLTVCGFIPITLLLEITKKLGAKKIEKISYDSSFSLSQDSSTIVGYSGLIVR